MRTRQAIIKRAIMEGMMLRSKHAADVHLEALRMFRKASCSKRIGDGIIISMRSMILLFAACSVLFTAGCARGSKTTSAEMVFSSSVQAEVRAAYALKAMGYTVVEKTAEETDMHGVTTRGLLYFLYHDGESYIIREKTPEGFKVLHLQNANNRFVEEVIPLGPRSSP